MNAPLLRFGVATADHQCEAYEGQDDIRDVWERVRGLVPRGRATDFWNRYREDVELAAKMGCTAFRLSLSWARLEPEPGKWDDGAFVHYRDVLQSMHDAGMVTVVTLVHNTWPLHVQAANGGAGILGPAFPHHMAAFARIVAQRLGDLIDYYVTLNEPNQLVYGYIKGFWMRAYPMPPGQPPHASSEQQMDDVLKLIPNLFRAHALSREVIRSIYPDAKVGTNPLVLGLPPGLQNWVDRNATKLKSPQDAKRQMTRLSQHSVLEGGKVDITIAQLTMTKEREHEALFSEPYYTAHVAVLHARSFTPPTDHEHWNGRIGVVNETLPATLVCARFPDADVQYYKDMDAAVTALRKGDVAMVFDDDIVLQQHVMGDLIMSPLHGHGQHFAVAMAFGSHALLDAVDRALRKYKSARPELPNVQNRKNITHIGKPHAAHEETNGSAPEFDKSLARIRKRGKLMVGIDPRVPGLCEKTKRGYVGLEPDLARAIASEILGDERKVKFVPLRGNDRMRATRNWLQVFFELRKSFGMFGTLLGTNWWNLGMAGKLPEFLCPRECIGTLDYVGVDYYWGVPSFWPGRLHRLSAAADFRYGSAPVWPRALSAILRAANGDFPGKPIIVIENGCVTSADGFSRVKYLEAHIEEVRRSIDRGIPVVAYLCWSITSNREWGLHFDDNSDFGLYHIDLDNDPSLKRIRTEACDAYERLIAEHTAPASEGEGARPDGRAEVAAGQPVS